MDGSTEWQIFGADKASYRFATKKSMENKRRRIKNADSPALKQKGKKTLRKKRVNSKKEVGGN